MKKRTYVNLDFRTTVDLGIRSKALEFLNLILSQAKGSYCPEKFGPHGGKKYPFDQNDLTLPLETWLREPHPSGHLYLERKRPFDMFMSIDWYRGPMPSFNRVSVVMEERYFKSVSHTNLFLNLAIGIYDIIHPVYGYIAHDTEEEMKIGSLTPPSSIKLGTLQEHLPGIFWANFFGPVYVNWFGRDKFLTAPCYLRKELSDGGFLLLTSASPFNYNAFGKVVTQIALGRAPDPDYAGKQRKFVLYVKKDTVISKGLLDELKGLGNLFKMRYIK